MATARALSRWALLALLFLVVSGGAGHPAAARAEGGIRFVANAGQMDARARFQALGGATAIWLDEGGIRLALAAPGGDEAVALRIAFEGLGDAATLEALERLPGHVSYYSGRDPAAWQEKLPLWGAVRYRGEGRELVVRSEGELLALSGDVALRIEGAPLVASDGPGLHVALPWGVATLPVVAEGMALAGEAPYGPQSPDQTLLYSTYIGTPAWDEATTVARDAQGRIYAAGHTLSLVFPERPGLIEAPQHAIETFVVRIIPGQTTFDYLLFIDSDVEDFATGMVLDAQNRAFVVGHTDSITNFPATPGAYDTTPNGSFDAYALRVESDGTLGWATLLGGEAAETAAGIALDAQGQPIITGGTWSENFPTTPGALNPTIIGDRDIFLSRFSADGSQLLYSTFLGGTGQDQAEAMALDAQGGINVTGWTRSDDIPVTPGVPWPTLRGSFDAFVMRLAPAGNALTLATYLGGAVEDRGYALRAPADELVVAGRTMSTNFPTTPNALDRTLGGGTCDFAPCPDAFVVRLDRATGALRYGTYLGAEGWDEARALALGESGLYVGGTTGAPAFPVTPGAYDTTLAGPRDAFLTLLSPDGTALRYGTFFGGSNSETINAVWAEPGMAWVAGLTDSVDFPTTPDAYDRTHDSDYDAFVAGITVSAGGGARLFLPLVVR